MHMVRHLAPGRAAGATRQPGRRAAVAALGALALAASLAACSSGGSGNSGSSAPAAGSGTTLRAGIVNPPDSLDPSVGQGGNDYLELYPMFDRLFNFDPQTGALQPGLALSGKYTDAGKLAYQLTLRQGVKFSDGTPVNAAAVKASFEHYISSGIYADLGSTYVKSFTVNSTYVLTINLAQQYSALPYILADRAGMIVSPAALTKYGKNFAIHPVGAGPYKFASQVTGSSITLVRNTSYWDPKAVHLAGITFTIYQAAQAMESAERAGQIDFAEGVAATDVPSLKQDSSLVTQVLPSLAYDELVFNPKVAGPLSNVKIRQAINYAINRTAVNQVLQGGLGKPMWEIMPPGNPYYNTAISPTYPYSAAKAKQLVASSGYKGSISFNCLLPTPTPWQAYAPLIQSELAAVGIKMNLVSEGVVQALTDYNVHQKDPCFFIGFSGRPDPWETFEQNFASYGIYNGGRYNFGIDGLLSQANKIYAPTARKQIFDQMASVIQQTAPFVPLVTTPLIDTYTKRVQDFVPNFQGKDNLSTISLGS
jgi:peptide/nickel transport system substrate-binding protein